MIKKKFEWFIYVLFCWKRNYIYCIYNIFICIGDIGLIYIGILFIISCKLFGSLK